MILLKRMWRTACLVMLFFPLVLPACGGDQDRPEPGEPGVVSPGLGGPETTGREYTLRGGPAPAGGVMKGDRYRLSPLRE